MRRLRWSDGVKCPRCGGKKVTTYEKKTNPPNKYECFVCNRTFTDLSGTIFANSKLPLSKWFECLKLILHNNTVTLYLAENLQVSWNTAYRMRKILEGEMMKPRSFVKELIKIL